MLCAPLKPVLKVLTAFILAAGAWGGVAFAQDRDGDGHVAASAGGDDCDDNDPSRYPGNTEVADRDNHDEDCDPTTFGRRDDDGDGFVPDWACNVDSSGKYRCGRDCDDTVAVINPLQIDVCNGRDDNCNGEIDEDQPCELLRGLMDEAEADQAERRAERRVDELTENTRDDLGPSVPGVAQTVPGIADTGGGDSCHSAVQGKIAWNYRGSKQWSNSNIATLCEGAENSTAPAECFREAMHGQTDAGDGSTQWQWREAVELCAGTRSADQTIACYKDDLSKGRSQAQAIDACKGRF